MMILQFKTRNIATTAGFLSLAECRHIVDAMQSHASPVSSGCYRLI